jgi:hypothetical protein
MYRNVPRYKSTENDVWDCKTGLDLSQSGTEKKYAQTFGKEMSLKRSRETKKVAEIFVPDFNQI